MKMKNLNLRILLNAKPVLIILFLALVVVFWSGESRAQISTAEQSEETVSPKALSPNPQMTDEQLAALKQAREEFTPSAACVPSSAIGFSVLGFYHVSQSTDQVLGFDKQLSDTVVTNEGNVWRKKFSMFLVPCDGLYSMTVSFVRDPYYSGGTNDDVIMYIVVNPATGNQIPVAIPGYAWAGEGNATARTTGTYSVVYRLKAGDIVQAWTHSDGLTNAQLRRHLIEYSFSGYLVAP